MRRTFLRFGRASLSRGSIFHLRRKEGKWPSVSTNGLRNAGMLFVLVKELLNFLRSKSRRSGNTEFVVAVGWFAHELGFRGCSGSVAVA